MNQQSQNNFQYVIDNLNNICYNVNSAISKYRKSDDKVEIMAVTKTVSPEIVNIAINNGIKLLGENRVQEYLQKKEFYDTSAQVHFIGHLQSNKVKYIINDCSVIQSVGTLKLAKEINRLSKINNITKDILIEVNIGGEDSKSGVSVGELYDLVKEVSELQNIKIRGLMAIPPIGSGENIYAKMENLYVDLSIKKMDNVDMNILSIGMSNDYETAIKFGSNLIRIGTTLFGARNYLEGF